MGMLYSIFTFLFFIAFVVGMIKPGLFIKSVESKHKRLKIFGVWFLASIILAAIVPNDEKSGEVEAAKDKVGNVNDSTTVTSGSSESEEVAENWIYEEDVDEMTDKITYTASCRSTDYTELDFPYNNSLIYMTITCRKSPQYGTDVMLRIPEGQFNCGVGGTKVKVRFDEEKMMTFQALEPSDNSSCTLFIQGAEGFIKKLRNAKKVLISVEFFQNGSFTYHFNTEGLKWEH